MKTKLLGMKNKKFLLSADNLLFAILANIATIIEYKMKEKKF